MPPRNRRIKGLLPPTNPQDAVTCTYISGSQGIIYRPSIGNFSMDMPYPEIGPGFAVILSGGCLLGVITLHESDGVWDILDTPNNLVKSYNHNKDIEKVRKWLEPRSISLILALEKENVHASGIL